MYNKNDLERLVIGNKPIRCERCNGKMHYIGGGKYECCECGYISLDDFGKVKEFLEENGPSPAAVVSSATGVKTEVIEMFLKTGRVEIPEGSKYYIRCEKCGYSIRYGRYCPECVKELMGSIATILNEDMGEKPRVERKSDMRGKMHYLNKRI